MNTREYTTSVTVSPRKAVRGDLLEDGIVIAKFSKPANGGWNYEEVRIKFLSERAAARFDAFCDCLSRAETLEALTDCMD